MASMVLFPPIIDSYMPAFKATKRGLEETPCRIYFSLSNFNTFDDIKSIQVSIKYQENNLDAVNNIDSQDRFRQTGIILDVKPHKTEEPNLYFFDLYNEDMNGNRDIHNNNMNNSDYIGWLPGKIYKLQIRLSGIDYMDSLIVPDMTQSKWLSDVENNTHFSEWSTICILKVIGEVNVQIPILEFDTTNESFEYSHKTLFLSTLDLNGVFSSEDESETLYSYRVKIYEGADATDYTPVADDSGILYTNQYREQNEFKYLSKIELEANTTYTIVIDFVTRNDYSFSIKVIATIKHGLEDPYDCTVSYLFSDINTRGNDEVVQMFDGISTLDEEEEEGRIALKVTANNNASVPCYGNFYIRRASSKDGFRAWEDIYLITLKGDPIDSLEVIYDYTIESGVFYMYGIQSVDVLKNRGILNANKRPTMRNFNFSYLLGQNNQQLKLMFDNTMNSYKIQVSETKSETIGHQFPKVVRNNAVYYKIFPINGLISYLMDPNSLFIPYEDLYGESVIEEAGSNISDLYLEYNKAPKALAVDADYNGMIETGGSRTLIDYNSGLPILDDEGKPILVTPSVDYIFDRNVTLRENLGEYPVNYGPSSDEKLNGKHFPQYDYIHEKDFREAVLKFLYDGQPKLFKSPTEGNIIVRLMDINCTPVQPLNRMLYSFTSNGNEIAENTVDNYRKYKFVDVPEVSEDLFTNLTKIGQVQMEFKTGSNGDDIIEKIYEKHHRMKDNYGGYQAEIDKIHHLRITIDQKPFRIKVQNGEAFIYTLGNQFIMSNDRENELPKEFTIYNTMQMYEFDERSSFDYHDHIYLLGDAENAKNTVKATIDYLYDIKEQVYIENQIDSRHFDSILGQFYGSCEPGYYGYSIYQELERRYEINWDDRFRKLNTLSSIEIQAIPNSVFQIQDAGDSQGNARHSIVHVINETGVLNLHELTNIKEIKYMGWYDKAYNFHTLSNEIPSTTVLMNYHATIETGTYAT